MEIENITNNILNNFNNVSPLLLNYFRRNRTISLLISLFPYKIKIISYFLKTYLNKNNLNSDYKYYIKLDNKIDQAIDISGNFIGGTNMDNLALSWWILKNKNITNLTNIKYENIISYKNNLDFVKFNNLMLNDLNNIKFQFNNINYMVITTQSDDKKKSSLCLYSNSIENCEKLIEHSIIEYKNMSKNLKKQKILIYKLRNKQVFSLTKELEYIELKLKKNKENTFLEDNISDIYNQIDYFFSEESQQFKCKNAIPNKLNILLYGIPGSGKTTLIYTLANVYKLNIFKLYLSEIKTNEEFENMVSNVKDNSMILIEEIDCCNWCRKRINTDKNENKNENKNDLFGSSNNNSSITLDTLLNYLEGYEYLNNCIIVITSNHPEHLDPALLREGRIDLKYEFTYLSIELISKIIKYFMNYDLSLNDIEKLKDIKISLAQLTNIILMNLNRNQNMNINLIFDELVKLKK